jgi:hypothetical protein
MAMTTEERKARDAERKRLSRAAARAAAASTKPRTADDADAKPSTAMHEAVEKSLSAMKWLVDSDAAATAQARMLAASVDRLQSAGEETKALSAHRALLAVLNDLGGTPTVRLQRELRSQKLKPEVPSGSSNPTPEGNVSKFERPPKRKKA